MIQKHAKFQTQDVSVATTQQIHTAGMLVLLMVRNLKYSELVAKSQEVFLRLLDF